jgi:CRISPR/Cas system CSM-associated protein Csm5 (group 7 of RAMP superfamily)
MYGDYSDYMSYEVDKRNMQTISGKDITICPEEIIQLVTGDGKEDVWSILNEFYYIYNSNLFSNKQVKFDLLDDFMKYTRRKQEAYSECDYGNDVKIFRSR